MLNAEDRQKLNDLASRVAAEDHYDDHPDYGKVPKGADLEGREWGAVSNIIGGLKPQVFWQLAMKDIDKISGDLSKGEYIEEQILDNTNYDSFSLVSYEKGSIVLLAKSEDDLSILRIVPHIDSRILQPNSSGKESDRKVESMRCGFQGMLQTTDDNIEVGNVLQIEVLPFGKVVDLIGDEKLTYRKFLNDICDDTCYNPDDLKEVMVLPDSTLTLFDAGECSYKKDFLDLPLADQLEEEYRSQNLVQTRLKSWGLPKELVWTHSNGDLKQRTEFPTENYDFVTSFPSDDTPTVYAP